MKLCGNASRLQLQRGSMNMIGLLDEITVECSTCGGGFLIVRLPVLHTCIITLIRSAAGQR